MIARIARTAMLEMQGQNRPPLFFALSIALSMIAGTSFLGTNEAWAGDADGAAASANKTSTRVLNGTAKDREEVTSSIRLVPPTPVTHLLTGAQSHVQTVQPRMLNGGAQSRTLNGGTGTTQLNGGADAGKPPISVFNVPNAAKTDVYHPVLPSRITVIPQRTYTPSPTKWNYSITPKNGVMTWANGYASTKVAVPAHAAAMTVRPTTGAAPVRGVLQGADIVPVQRAGVDPVVSGAVRPGAPAKALEAAQRKLPTPPPAAALQATPKLLTELHTNEKRSLNWDEWYRRVCKVVYDQWELNQACPGKACVQVTVWSGREIEARVMTFTPVQDASRDLKKETLFRETALRAINSLGKTPVLDFPISSNRTKVVFDLDMNRSVNGPTGIQVSKFHDSEEINSKVSSKTGQNSGAARTTTAQRPTIKVSGYRNSKASARSARSGTHSQTAATVDGEPPPNALQTAAQSFVSKAFNGSMDMANSVSKRLQFLRWKDNSAPAANQNPH